MLGPYARKLKAADLRLTQNVELTAVILVHFLLASDYLRPERVSRACHDLVYGLLYDTLNIG